MRAHTLIAALLGTLIFFLPTSAISAPPAPAAQPGQKPATNKTAPAASAGMRVFIDPQTGQIIDHPVTAEQKRAAQQAQSVASPVVQTIVHPNGMIETRLNGAANAQIVATSDGHGHVHLRCNDASHQLLPQAQPQTPEARDDR